MAEGRLYIDFNEMLDGDHVLLSLRDEKVDSRGCVVKLHQGMKIGYWSDDADENDNEDNIIGDAIVVPNPYFGSEHGWGHVKWACRLATIFHESEMGESFQRDWRHVRSGSFIDAFWLAGTLPIQNGIHFSWGRSYALNVAYYPQPRITRGGWFDLTEFYRTSRNSITNIDVFKRHILPAGDVVCVGEGSHGSEGFVAVLDQKERLKWVLYAEESNPFVSILEKNEHTVWVEASAGYWLEIDVKAPEEMQVRWI